MISAFNKWFFLALVILSWVSSRGDDVSEQGLLLVIKKINENEVNLTCLAKEEVQFDGLSLTGPENDTKLENIRNRKYGNFEITKNETITLVEKENDLKIDLPPVLDFQWENFPIHGPEHIIIIRENETLWISIRYKEGLTIRYQNNVELFNVNCQDSARWVHLKLRSNSTNLSGESDMCTIDGVSLNSKESYLYVNSFHKVHRYNVLAISENEIKTNISGKEIRSADFNIGKLDRGHVRLSYFLNCSSCNATIKLEGEDGIKMNTEYFELNSNNWQVMDIKVDANADPNKTKSIVITLLSSIDSTSTFLIRNMFTYSEDTDHSISRIVSSEDISQYVCESIKSNVTAIPGSVEANGIKKDLRFPQSKLCYSNWKCYCSSGSKGDMCEASCKDGFWGDCTTRCDCCNRENICNKVDGSCGKTDNCNSRKIQGLNVNSTSTNIWGKVIFQRNSLQVGIDSIKIEYKRINANKWKKQQSLANTDNPYVNITNLTPNANYNVSVSLCSLLRCFDEYRFNTNISTICDKPATSELKLNIEQYTISLDHSPYSSKKGSCSDKISLFCNNKSWTGEISGLDASTDYTIDIKFQGIRLEQRTVRTKAAKPGSVQSLSFNEIDNLITWKAPQKPNGNLGPYIVNRTRLGSVLCMKKESYPIQKINESQLYFEPVPFSKYEVHVQATNEEGSGDSQKMYFETTPNNKITDYEKPKNFNINETHFEMEISDCDQIYGAWVMYESIFTCLDPICNNSQIVSTVNVSYTREENYLMALNTSLEPFTNYSLQTSIFRDRSSNSILVANKDLATKPQCPPPVRHLDVYSVSNNSISVRWKLPDPPRGLLEKTWFKFNNETTKTINLVLKDMTKCSLWDDEDYFCKKLENIYNQSIPIQVIAKNEDTKNCGEKALIETINLQETESEKPMDLKMHWKGDMDEILLTWKHPNKTNGQLTHFKVFLNSSSDNISEELFISNDYHIYNYSIKTFSPSTRYTVKVYPFNSLLGLPATLTDEIVTPPPYPVIDSNTKYSIDEKNNSIIHIPNIKNTTRNSSMIVSILKGDCNSTFINDSTILLQDDNVNDDSNKTINIDLKKEFPIANNSTYNDYSIVIIVTNTFEGITRNTSHCLMETPIKLSATSLYLWIGLIIFTVLLTICAILIYKYCPLKCPIQSTSKLFRTRGQINNNSLSQRASSDGEYVELTLKFGNDTGTIDRVSYENQPLIPITNVIQTKNLFTYLKSAVKYGDECELYNDFDSIPLKLSNFSEISIKNKIKNRYLNILPYEETRVILKSGKYINASFIQGYKTERAYIATQGPKLQTVDDFWEMIFENKSKLIAMLCPLKEGGNVKCDQYWPDFRNKILNSRNLEIEFDAEKNCGVYVERHFFIICGNVQHKVIQLQFTAWMDHQIPSSSQFLHEFLERFHTLHDYSSPAVVHCSAGSGRTGTLILCDHLLKMNEDTSTLDFPLVLCSLRKERIQMVQTKHQYHLAHVVIYEYLCIGKNLVVCDDSFEKNVLKIIESKAIIQKEITSLKNLQTIDVSTFKQKPVQMDMEDNAKNRDKHIIPTYSGIIYLETSKLEKSTYINAINVDGYNQSEKFIVTQQPLITSKGSTLSDFWRLVMQTKPEVIVSLEGQVVNFYPTSGELLINNNIKLNCIKTHRNQKSTTVTVKVEMENKEYKVKIMESNIKLEATRESLSDFINFYNEFRNHFSNKESKILVTCLNGCDVSGIFVALDYIIEKMLQQEVCDVFLAVRVVRRTRSNFIINEEQYEFLYRCALEIRKSMCTVYSNVS